MDFIIQYNMLDKISTSSKIDMSKCCAVGSDCKNGQSPCDSPFRSPLLSFPFSDTSRSNYLENRPIISKVNLQLREGFYNEHFPFK